MKRRDFVTMTAGGMASLLAQRAHGQPTVSSQGRVLVRGATVYDGSGATGTLADVAISGGLIEAVGERLSETGAEVVDARGLALAPGFIDIHSHTDLVLLVDPLAPSKLRQGVTTEVAGQDGGSVGPWTSAAYEETREQYRGRYGVEIDFDGLEGFFRRLERDRPAVNFASMVGAGTVRSFVIGDDDRPATADEIEAMVRGVRDALTAGACGLSSGLEYVPGAFASLDELVALAQPLQGTGLPYASHMRNEDDQLLAAIEEALNVGRLAGVPVHISHLKAQGRRNWWKADPALLLLEHANADGLEVTFDRYPYVAYSTGLASLFPVWSRDGGTGAFLDRLNDPATAPAIERAVRDKVDKLGGWDAVLITSTGSEDFAWARGARVGELAATRGEEPYALVRRIIVQDRNRAGMVGFGMSEDNTTRMLAHPLGMVCSDGGARAVTGPLSEGSPHPRSYGTFPRVLGHYCREQNAMPLELAIHKMTGMPAARLGMTDRGHIASGRAADLVLFDPDTVADRATFEQPHQYPVGIQAVIVNGVFALRDGEPTGARPGKVLRARRGE
jgi:N-acyl-D-amino-acid deacylase